MVRDRGGGGPADGCQSTDGNRSGRGALPDAHRTFRLRATARSIVVLVRQIRVRTRNAELLGALVCHREEAADAAGDGILRHGRIGVVTELVEARVAVVEAQLTGVPEVLGHVVTEDLERALDASARGDGRLRRASEVRVVEVHEAVRGRPHLAALAQLLPRGDASPSRP